MLQCAPYFAMVTVDAPPPKKSPPPRRADDRNDGEAGRNGDNDEFDDDPVEVPTVNRYGNHAGTVTHLLTEGYDVDDDNKPALENIQKINDLNNDNYISNDG